LCGALTALDRPAQYIVAMPHQNKVLLDQAAPLKNAGQWQEAIDLYATVFRSSVEAGDLENLLEAILRAGFCYRALGNSELAVEYFELGYAVADLNRQQGVAGRALNGLATLYHTHGNLEQAEYYYNLARDLALQGGDLLVAAHIDQNLGALHNVRGDLSHALSAYQSALQSFRDSGHTKALPGVLNNLGMLHIDLEQFDAATTCLDEALDRSRANGDVVTEAIVQVNRTELMISQGDLDSARTTCDAAFEIFSRLREHSGRAEALKFYGVIYREANKPYLAETHLREAIEVSATHNYPLEEAEALRELARVLRMQNRNQEALQALNRAHELFAALRAKHDAADIHKRLDQLEEEFLSLVRSWGESIEAKDRYTRGHCQRVADYACRIAKEVGLNERDLVWFRMGAFLHDVGKTEVPGEILNKAGRLTDEERGIIEMHTVTGDEILAPIPFPWDIRPMVRSHHERWDGHGYPDQLQGTAIPLTARILRVADVFDALTTNRSYREPLSPEQAFQIMQSDYGSFDPNIFEIFRALLPVFSKIVLADQQPQGASNTRRLTDKPS
jgi:putative nucleotidyltransferase with HDIG domain